MPELASVLADLTAEGETLDAFVADLPAESWRAQTPAAGWSVAHQIAHLAWTDDVARLAAQAAGTEVVGSAFGAVLQEAGDDPYGFVDTAATAGAQDPPAELLARWRAGRAALVAALVAVPDGARLPWFGPPMAALSMATARVMETWAHGLDVADALGLPTVPTDRLRHIAHIGVRTRDFAYRLNDRPPPAEPFRVELTGPFGDLWAWGPPGATQQVAGPALDFCLLVTQRRNRADLAVVAIGGDADAWLDIAQAFAGPPGGGRAPDGTAT